MSRIWYQVKISGYKRSVAIYIEVRNILLNKNIKSQVKYSNMKKIQMWQTSWPMGLRTSYRKAAWAVFRIPSLRALLPQGLWVADNQNRHLSATVWEQWARRADKLERGKWMTDMWLHLGWALARYFLPLNSPHAPEPVSGDKPPAGRWSLFSSEMNTTAL